MSGEGAATDDLEIVVTKKESHLFQGGRALKAASVSVLLSVENAARRRCVAGSESSGG